MIAVAQTNGHVIPSRIEELVQQVSASRLGMWSSCRLKFYFKYVAQIEKPATPALHGGKVVHAVLQAWNITRWRGQTLTTADLRGQFNQSWENEQVAQKIDWEGNEAAKRDGAWRLLEVYFAQTPIPSDEKPQAVEVRLEADLGAHGLPTLIGIIDLVRAGGVVVDFKTSAQTPNSERVAHQTEMQLTCYSVLYRQAVGKQEAGFELHHLVKVKEPKLVITALPPATKAQHTRLFKQMESYVEGVSREDFVPSVGMACLSCQFFNECRRWS